jgi:triacylglycerol lipase
VRVPKPPPQYSSALVLHPEQDGEYRHFEDAAHHPFGADPAGGVPRVNVWWLAEAALLSYWGPNEAVPIFHAAGLTAEFLSEGGSDCYVAWHDDWLVVAFRGTQPQQWRDVLADTNIVHDSWPTGHVHRGFKKALGSVWPRLEARLADLAQGRSVWFCGHSLGAALATLAADRYEGTRGVCTFGSPRVGDPAFMASFNQKLAGRSLRYVNHHDIVTHVPTERPIRYEHVDERRYIARNGTVSGGAPPLPHFFADLFGDTESLLELVEDAHLGSLRLSVPFLLDHMPKAYALWTWNDYDANG